MKKVILIATIGFLIPFNGFGQQQISIKDVAVFSTPKNTEKLDKEKLEKEKKSAQKLSKIKNSPIVYEQFKGESFYVRNFLVQLNAASVTPSSGFLEQRKREMDDLFSLSQPQVYITSIKRFKNNSAVITNYEESTENMGYFIFKSFNERGDKVLVGTMEYEKGNKADAEQVLYEMLNSVKFEK